MGIKIPLNNFPITLYCIEAVNQPTTPLPACPLARFLLLIFGVRVFTIGLATHRIPGPERERECGGTKFNTALNLTV